LCGAGNNFASMQLLFTNQILDSDWLTQKKIAIAMVDSPWANGMFFLTCSNDIPTNSKPTIFL